MESKIDINLATELLRQKLVQDINSSGLPISTLYLIVNELQWKTEKAYYAELNTPAQKIIKEGGEGLPIIDGDTQEESE